MRWPWQARREREAAHARADAALEKSREQREDATRWEADARQRAARWRRWQRENHFAEGFKRALGDR